MKCLSLNVEQTLIDCSFERNDENTISVRVLVRCREEYTSDVNKRGCDLKETITSTIRPSQTRARLSKPLFWVKEFCFSCCNELNEESEGKKLLKIGVRYIESHQFRSKIRF